MKDVFNIFRREFYTVFRDHGVLTFFILLTLAYPLVYTYIYSNEVVREVPVAVVDRPPPTAVNSCANGTPPPA